MRTRTAPRSSAALLTLTALAQFALALTPLHGVRAQSTSPQARFERPIAPVTATDLLQIVTSQVADLSDDGRWLAVLQQTRADGFGTDVRRDGDPSYIRPAAARLVSINTATGQHQAVFSEPRVLRSPVWSHDGSRLALLALRGDRLQPLIWDRVSGRTRTLSVPAGWYVAENSDVRWSRDGSRVIVALRRDRWRGRVTAEFARMTQGPVFVQDGRDPFLAWDRLRREGNVRAVYSLDAVTSQPRELLPEGMISAYQVSEDDSLVTWEDDITRQTDYDVIFGTERRLMARVAGEAAQVVLPSLKGVTLAWSSDGRQLAWSREGKVWVQRAGGGSPARQLAGPDSAASSTGRAATDTSAAARADREAQRFTVVRWSPRGDALLLSNREGFWVAPADGAPRTRVVASSDSGTAPRYQPIDWSADGRHLYFSIASRTEWGRGIARYDRESKTLQELVKDTRLYGGVRLAKAGDVLVYSSGEGNRPQELYVADAGMRNARRVTDGNPQLAGKAFARTRLITYHDMDGATRYGVAYLPADYDASKRYPTLFNIYEEFFDDTFDPTINVLTASGYVVVKPSVGFETGFPGEAWAKGVTAAANHLIEAGIADSARLGVFGTSYGGYATNLLITQTKRFRAAANISGKVDMISFYTDSPRLGVRNIHAAEKSQDRLGATLWQQPQKYVAHSAVMFADRITTPLLLMTGALDPNVPADNTREMFYALRRLGKDVTWVNYMNGGHGTPSTTPADFVDFHDRLVAFFDRHLKGAPGERVVEAIAFTGEPLSRAVPPAATLARMEQQLADARSAWRRTPANADSIIWYGRRTAYPGRFNEAIAIFSDGIATFPGDARFYRHRGHRYISTRQLDKAIADLEKAYDLTKHAPDEVEPDGQPNARNIPTSTLKGNIRYHLALAYYLNGDFAKALPLYQEDVTASRGNPDMLVASSHWLYMTLRRLGRNGEAAKVLVPIRKDMDIIENGAYHKLLLLYKGELTPGELLGRFGTDGGLEDITTAYGVGNWHLYNGRRAEAETIFRRIVSARGQWASFGYLAAEAELARMR
jgi:dipeptidyl aminopeptidase/acylaminoacyl peptidase/tetratricopeptide (TPR) repeat protein